ncbi:MAG: nicotinamide riboside transporter PnuC [bacterium]|nr:nicotinamide riboside transporter PnuC [Gammaproteobacteria bacterium]HIL83179.1 nicotinamide riboside transporter PnuC [Pseudomonadales bacterium]
MTDFLSSALGEFHQNSLLELIAVVLAIAYLLLAVRQHIACWYAAFISTAIFLYVFWQVNLYMESGLQVYYLGMAVYGWWAWQRGRSEGKPGLTISTWSLRQHLIVIVIVVVATFVSGTLLSGTEQRLGYLDSFTTWGAVVATFMVTRKVLENWLYWIVIDSASLFLYFDRELYFTMILFLVYLVIIFFGFRSWLREYRLEAQDDPTHANLTIKR